MERPSSWTRVARALAVLAAALGLLALPAGPGGAAGPGALAAQDGLDDLCGGGLAGPIPECYVAASAVRLIQPRVGLALWGGSPVPGSASTLGMRLGRLPRFSTGGRLVVLPLELPPLADRTVQEGQRALATGLSGQTTVGLLPGWSPLPTVGGVLAVDAIGRASLLLLPRNHDFQNGTVLGASLGLRLGLLRESFTLPGLSLTGSYGRSTSFGYGDPDGAGAHVRGAVGGWSASAAATKRLGPVGLTLGASADRYTSDVELGYPGGAAGGESADAATDRVSAFANLSWTFLIAHAALELGWQEATVPESVRGLSLDPAGWWVGAAFRLSI